MRRIFNPYVYRATIARLHAKMVAVRLEGRCVGRLLENGTASKTLVALVTAILVGWATYYTQSTEKLKNRVHAHDIVLAELAAEMEHIATSNASAHARIEKGIDEIQQFMRQVHPMAGGL